MPKSVLLSKKVLLSVYGTVYEIIHKDVLPPNQTFNVALYCNQVEILQSVLATKRLCVYWHSHAQNNSFNKDKIFDDLHDVKSAIQDMFITQTQDLGFCGVHLLPKGQQDVKYNCGKYLESQFILPFCSVDFFMAAIHWLNFQTSAIGT